MSPFDIRLAIIGLGYVGLPLAVAFGKLMPVIGFDIDISRVDALKSGYDKTLEVTAVELQETTGVAYSANVVDLARCNVFIITVPTPIDSANRPNLVPLLRASETVAGVMPEGAIVIYESTVYPGATEEACVPILEKVSGRIFNHGFFCGYSPERVNPGDKVNTLTTIRKITSGSTPEVAEVIDRLYNRIVVAGTYKANSIRVAEAAKVIENTQRDLNIALMNELSVLFARLGIDTQEVLEAAGSKWNFAPFRPGLVGGHCIGVDPYYLTYKAEQVGYIPQIILAGRRINDNMARYAARNTIKLMLQAGMDVARCKIGVLGITFKENCPDIRNSKVAELVRELQAWGAQVVVTDPWASADDVWHVYGLELSAVDAEHPVDSLVVAVGHTEYRALTAETLRSYCGHATPVLTDVKSLYDRHQAAGVGFTVFRL